MLAFTKMPQLLETSSSSFVLQTLYRGFEPGPHYAVQIHDGIRRHGCYGLLATPTVSK